MKRILSLGLLALSLTVSGAGCTAAEIKEALSDDAARGAGDEGGERDEDRGCDDGGDRGEHGVDEGDRGEDGCHEGDREDEGERGDEEEGDRGDDECADDCAERAWDLYDGCVDDGGDEGRCAEYARGWYADCLDESCEDDERGEDDEGGDACADGCAERAEGWYDACVADGNDEGDCGARAREWYGDCLEDYCGDE